MPNYDLNRLGEREFEHMSQSLLKKVIGNDTITFGEGRDGGREATFTGKAPYPSQIEFWKGEWIFQVKFHDTGRITHELARQKVLTELKTELDKIVNKYKRRCDNYILITNVPLSSVSGSGTHDRVAAEIVPLFKDKISNIRVWGADDIYRFLDAYSDVRQAYLHFLVPGDLIAELMSKNIDKTNKLAGAIKLYLNHTFSHEQYVQLDQAGGLDDDRLPLQKVFIDLDVQFRPGENVRVFADDDTLSVGINKKLSAMTLLFSGKLSKIVLIGGPGEGKSTLGQYLAQVHRATLINRLKELASQEDELDLNLHTTRIPFRIILKDYAQWITETTEEQGLELYICERMQKIPGLEISPKELHHIIQSNPCLIILDGLDEVTEQSLRSLMLDLIATFLDTCRHVLQADLQVLATTRPNGYSDQFDPNQFVHLRLTKLESPKIYKYLGKWIEAKRVDEVKARRLTESIREYLGDHQIRFLMDTPLQVTILILITYIGGTPPKQREALFNEFLEVIYKREKAKAKAIIKTDKQLLFELHEYLGYVLHSRASVAQDVNSVLKKPEFIKYVKTFLKFKNPDYSSEMLDKQIELIVKDAQDRLVLIVGPQEDLFGFELRSIQEFFAAAHLANARNSTQRFDRFEAIACFSHWRNVTLFFAGRVGRVQSAEAPTILEVCRAIDRRKPDEFLRRGEMLSLELAADRSFGPDRRLQRSAIEYGLTLNNVAPNDQRAREIRSILEKLPSEDIQSHVIPTLKNRLLTLGMPYLETALNLYQNYDHSGTPLLELLDRFFRSSEQQDVLFAISKCLEFKINAHWVCSRISQHLPNLSFEDFVRVFAKASLRDPAYTQQCLANFTLTNEHITGLLSNTIEDTFSLSYGRSKLVSDQPFIDFSNSTNIVFAIIYSFSLFSLFGTEMRMRRYSIEIDSKKELYLLCPSRNFSQPLIEYILYSFKPIYEILRNLDLATQQYNLGSYINALYWLTSFIIEPITAELLDAFISSYIEMRNNYPGISSLLRHYGEIINPFITLLTKAIDLESPIIIEDARFLILQSSDLQKNVESFYLIRDFIEFAKPLLSNDQLMAITLFGVWVPVNNLGREQLESELRKQFHVGLDTFMEIITSTSIMEISNIKMSSEALSVIFESIFLSIERNFGLIDLSATIRNLNVITGQSKNFVFSKCLDLLLLLLQKKDVNPKTISEAIIKLVLILSTIEVLPEDIFILVLQYLGNKNNSQIEVQYIDISSINFVNVLLIKLEQFLHNSDPLIAQGAEILINILIDCLIYRVEMTRPQSHILNNISFNLKITLDLLRSKNQGLKIIGIKLLTFSSLPIVSEGAGLLQDIFFCKDNREAEAWSNFVKYSGITQLDSQPESLTAWIEFFEHILERRANVMPIITKSALEKYSTLIISQESEITLDEKALGLPLGDED